MVAAPEGRFDALSDRKLSSQMVRNEIVEGRINRPIEDELRADKIVPVCQFPGQWIRVKQLLLLAHAVIVPLADTQLESCTLKAYNSLGRIQDCCELQMRLGIFGGTFDPVHYGHLLVAEQCREECRLDQVWFIPAGVPPHKLAQTIAPAKARAEMLDLAVAGHDCFRVDRRELDRSDPCFTVETLGQLQAEDVARELFFLLGGDSLIDFPTWREPARIVELARLVVVNRGGVPLPDLTQLRRVAGESAPSRVDFVTMPGVDISSSDLRRRVREGKSIRYMTPRAVECYIETHGLYKMTNDQ